MTVAVPASEFSRNFSHYQRRADAEPIQVVDQGITTGYFISPDDFEQVQRILAASRKAYAPAELPDHLKTALTTTRMDPKHDHLNALMDEE